MLKKSVILSKLKFFVQTWPVLSVSLYLILITNFAFWKKFFSVAEPYDFYNSLFSVSTFILLTLLTAFILLFVRFSPVFKPTIIVILLFSSVASYFMNNYGIVIDAQMLHNTMETDINEVRDLMSIRFFLYLTVLGIIPALFVSKLEFQHLPFTKQLISNFSLILISCAVICANVLIFSADFVSLFKNHREMRYMFNPGNYIYSTVRFISNTINKHDDTIIPVGLDAKQIKSNNEKKISVLILVVGETARAQNFSLNGYEKLTNPLLSKEDIINYTNFHSCGTSTHTSLPCMFSFFKRAEFNETDAPYHENMTDVLSHAGLKLLWRDNNSGCKGVCNRIETQDMKHLHIDSVCNERECYDEVLLDHLDNYIDSINSDAVIILHQNGSHGPAYYLRYPKSFRQFMPECESNILSSCSHDSLINTYDNTILYTDYILSRVINLLKNESDKFNTAMLYVSDHGESLGENHIYLHSMPYFVAPETQTHVPFISWFSSGFLKSRGLDKSCLLNDSSSTYSHDYLFHSVLGLMDIDSSAYNPELDMFARCREKNLTGTLSVNR